MQYDVFISYSSNDRLIAETILNALKRRGITCWIAPDSIAAGTSWREAIVDGLEQSRLMLVVLSEKSIKSWHVSNELGLAADSGRTIVPLRVADVQLPKAMRYSLAGFQWVDAFPDVAKHLDKLSQDIELILAKLASESPEVSLAVPANGTTCQPGSLQTIRWNAVTAGGSSVADVCIELRRSGREMLRIADVATGLIPTTNEYAWRVPADLELANDYQLQVTVIDDAGRSGCAQAAMTVATIELSATRTANHSTPPPSNVPPESPVEMHPAAAPSAGHFEREAGEIALRDRFVLFFIMVLGYPIIGIAAGSAMHEIVMLAFTSSSTGQTIGLQYPASAPSAPPNGLPGLIVAVVNRIISHPSDSLFSVGSGLLRGALFGLVVGLSMTILAALVMFVISLVRRRPWQLVFEEWDESAGMVALGVSMSAMIVGLFAGDDGRYFALGAGLVLGVILAAAHRSEMNQRRQAKLLGQ